MDWVTVQMHGIWGFILALTSVLILFYLIKFVPKRFKIFHPRVFMSLVVVSLIISLTIPVGIKISKDRVNQHIEEMHPLIEENKQIIDDGDVMKDYEEMREAYFNLVEFDEESYYYDLSEYLEGVDPLVLLLEVEWTDRDDYYTFSVHLDDEKDSVLFRSQLPVFFTIEDSYYFVSQDWTVFGWKNKRDSSERNKIFRIESIDEDEVRIYVYAREEIFTLYKK